MHSPRALARANEVCTRVASRVRLWTGALPLCALVRDVVRQAPERQPSLVSPQRGCAARDSAAERRRGGGVQGASLPSLHPPLQRPAQHDVVLFTCRSVIGGEHPPRCAAQCDQDRTREKPNAPPSKTSWRCHWHCRRRRRRRRGTTQRYCRWSPHSKAACQCQVFFNLVLTLVGRAWGGPRGGGARRRAPNRPQPT